MAMGSYYSIIILNVNGLNAPTKRQRLAEWIQKQDPYICCLQEAHLKTRDTYRLKVKSWKKIFHTNGDEKKAEVAILIPDKVKVMLLSLVGLFVTPWTTVYQVLPSLDSPGKNTGVGFHFLLQEIFPTQGLNPNLPHCSQMLYCLSHQGSHQIKESLK